MIHITKNKLVKMLLLFFVFSFIIFLYLEKRLYGDIRFFPETWSGEVHIENDTLFVPWVTLTISPGTKILFKKGQALDLEKTPWTKFADFYIKSHNDPTGRKGYGQSHFELIGKIKAIGTKEKPIIFTSSEKNPEYADWDQIVLFGGSEMSNVEVSYTHNGVLLDGNNIKITDSKIHDSLWSCVDIFSSNNTIKNNEIYHCWHQGVGVKTRGQNLIEGNNIHDAWLSVNCEYGANPTIRKNKIRAAPIAQECKTENNNTIIEAIPDVPGGTYMDKLIYPST